MRGRPAVSFGRAGRAAVCFGPLETLITPPFKTPAPRAACLDGRHQLLEADAAVAVDVQPGADLGHVPALVCVLCSGVLSGGVLGRVFAVASTRNRGQLRRTAAAAASGERAQHKQQRRRRLAGQAGGRASTHLDEAPGIRRRIRLSSSPRSMEPESSRSCSANTWRARGGGGGAGGFRMVSKGSSRNESAAATK